MKTADLFSRITDCRMVGEVKSESIVKVTADPEKAAKNTLYIALDRKNDDIVSKALKAYEKGATVVSGEGEKLIFPHYEAKNIRRAFADTAYVLNGKPGERMKSVAVTGTNGKTTIVSLISHIAAKLGISHGTVGTLGIYENGNELKGFTAEDTASPSTTPDPDVLYAALSVMEKKECSVFVTEASSHALALSKLDPIRFDIGVFTNLTPDHMDFHASMEEYFKAKCRLSHLSDRIIVNADDKWFSELKDRKNALMISASGENKNGIYADGIKTDGLNGLLYNAHVFGETYEVRTPMFALYSVFNTLAAVTVFALLGEDISEAVRHVESFNGASGRCEKIAGGDGIPCVLTDYAHTPDALEKTLISVRKAMNKGRLCVVFGCGGDRDKTKRAPMGAIASRFADRIILTEDNSRSEDRNSIICDIMKGIGSSDCVIVPDRKEAIRLAVSISDENDVVIVCGKGHETYMIDKCGKRYFSDSEEIKKAIAEYRACGKRNK